MSTTTHMTDFISNNLNNNISLNKFYRTLLTVDSEDLSTINRIPYDDFFSYLETFKNEKILISPNSNHFIFFF